MSETMKREWLLLASYCGDENPLCSKAKPCPACLGMSNVFTFPEDVTPHYERELAPTWNVGDIVDPLLTHVAAYLDGMADNAPRHGYVDATSYHKAYEQGVREAAAAVRKLAPSPKPNPNPQVER